MPAQPTAQHHCPWHGNTLVLLTLQAALALWGHTNVMDCAVHAVYADVHSHARFAAVKFTYSNREDLDVTPYDCDLV